MSLASCRECGGQVSTEAGTCPHCGVGNPAHTRQGAQRAHQEKRTGAATVGTGVFAGIAGCIIVPIVIGFILMILVATCFMVGV